MDYGSEEAVYLDDNRQKPMRDAIQGQQLQQIQKPSILSRKKSSKNNLRSSPSRHMDFRHKDSRYKNMNMDQAHTSIDNDEVFDTSNKKGTDNGDEIMVLNHFRADEM